MAVLKKAVHVQMPIRLFHSLALLLLRRHLIHHMPLLMLVPFVKRINFNILLQNDYLSLWRTPMYFAIFLYCVFL